MVGTASTRPLRDPIGEDYNQLVSFGKEYKYMDTCRQYCIWGSCHKDPSLSKPFVCYPIAFAKWEAPTTTAPMTDNCVRTPRNSRKIRRHRWGHWVLGLRTPRNFCCSRGRRTGEMVRTPRCCKPRTPRTPRACSSP